MVPLNLALFLSFLGILPTVSHTQTLSPLSKWEVSKGLKNPECAYYDAGTQIIYVSSLAGDPSRTDGVGWISKLDVHGKVIQEKWVAGLSAPKGMRVAGGYLWVTDIQNLLKIDLKTGQIALRVLIPGSRFLNDVATGPQGEVYVSDTLASRIYEYREPTIRIFAQGDDLESPNGILVQGGKLIVAAWGRIHDFSQSAKGRLYSLDLQSKEKSPITAEAIGNLDGLEIDGNGNYLVSDPVAGSVFRVSSEGKVTPLLSGFKGSVDIGWIAESSTVLVPSMGEDKISAFDLK